MTAGAESAGQGVDSGGERDGESAEGVHRFLRKVQAGIDFIEANLDHELSFQEVARAAGVSPWHFQRVFKACAGETLKGYIRGRRFARACRSLVGTKGRILDIGLAAGYGTQESFSRAFKLRLGVTPGAFRKAGGMGFEHKKACIDIDYMLNLRSGELLEPVMLQVPARTFVGLRTRFFGACSEKNDMARKLPALWDAFLARLDEVPMRVDGACYGLVCPDGPDGEALSYCAVAEVAEVAAPRAIEVPAGMTVVHAPAQVMARFKHVGPVARLDHTVSAVYFNWLPGSRWRHAGGADVEIYGPEYDPSSKDCVTWYAIPVCAGPG